MATRKYTGKYPYRIREVYSVKGNRGVMMVVTNNGVKTIVSAEESGGKIPRVNEDIRDYVLGSMTIDKDGTVHQNPLTRVKIKSAPQRPVGTLKKPSARLVKRRKATAKAPKGFFANPVSRADRLTDDTPGDFSQSTHRVLGRAWSDAVQAKGKDFGDVYKVTLTWPDGEWLSMLFNTQDAARKMLTDFGFK